MSHKTTSEPAPPTELRDSFVHLQMRLFPILEDAGYDAEPIRDFSRSLGSVPIAPQEAAPPPPLLPARRGFARASTDFRGRWEGISEVGRGSGRPQASLGTERGERKDVDAVRAAVGGAGNAHDDGEGSIGDETNVANVEVLPVSSSNCQ